MSDFNVEKIREDFPGLSRIVNGHKISFLDSGASSQTPTQVIVEMNDIYNTHYANVHRGVYTTAQEISDQFENSRKTIANFINAKSEKEIIFTRNATESINLIARTWGDANINSGDVILLTQLEHHSNIVPWQQLAQRKGAIIKWVPIDSQARLDLSNLDELLKGVKIFAFTAASNVTGTITPVKTLVDLTKKAGAISIIDACQLVPHEKIDTQSLGADFIAFSGHKMLGPTGLGVLWGKQELLETMPPFLGGGSMISDVTLDGYSPADLPAKFEAGTPAFVEAVGTARAVKYLEDVGFDNIVEHEKKLGNYALEMFEDRFKDSVIVYGPKTMEDRLAVFSFSVKGIHPHDVSQLLDEYGVCVRAGHHCAKPLMRELSADGQKGIGATSRASVYLYNNEEDINSLGKALEQAIAFFC